MSTILFQITYVDNILQKVLNLTDSHINFFTKNLQKFSLGTDDIFISDETSKHISINLNLPRLNRLYDFFSVNTVRLVESLLMNKYNIAMLVV